ncbi:hypothetical protein AA103196_0575 [Ameyamaea chiangmaiensis NBRC 103196]|uniref:DUF721 domain-containing protein n=1 Tax=Ameyamaea chiangmaiensis TaxID=442969 RepID=A0A850PHR1_9PROT|nr:DUF721 domain-containing protein [Ameyamaea chiangmaiensis]MBS4074970.1 DUF721 domain-containing protein [Ameyamaea chiangmaiensis]NVN42169.1 DUF721 domain-containing protein [Ameyamaea chiangmaiensis]GBQ63378.1 hypothetical protein AA103196_0575 [Ameyamaea chiangmaiensis NBRC 103196]
MRAVGDQPERRRFALNSLGALMPAVTRPALHRRPGAITTIVVDWPEIVGPDLASVTAARRLVAGTLTVACAGPAALEINHRAPALVERVNRHCGQALVTRLKIVQDMTASSVAPRPRRAPPPPPIALPEVEDEDLRGILERLGARVRARQNGTR